MKIGLSSLANKMPDQNLPTNQPASEPQTSAIGTPADDIGTPTFPTDIPPTITPPSQSSAISKKTVATILGLLVLVGGLGAGLILVRQQQNIREKAAGPNPISVVCNGANSRGLLVVHQFNSEAACLACKNDPSDCVRRMVGQPSDPNVCPKGNNYIGTTTNPADGGTTTCSDLGTCGGSCSSTYPDCAAVQIDCLSGLGGGINAGNPSINCNCAAPPTTPPTTPPTVPPSPTGQCLNVQAYDTNWTEISDLSTLKAGDIVRFTVVGSATAGTFDKARFTINGVLQPEVTQTRPGSSPPEFYDEYTVPDGVSTFTVKGEVHNATLGWF